MSDKPLTEQDDLPPGYAIAADAVTIQQHYFVDSEGIMSGSTHGEEEDAVEAAWADYGRSSLATIADLRAKLAEAQREGNRVLRDLHAIVRGSGEPTTHGLDYTTIISSRLRDAERERDNMRFNLATAIGDRDLATSSYRALREAMEHAMTQVGKNTDAYAIMDRALRGKEADRG